ncbi:MAG: tetratricopeptide repeat protein [Planctomycetota bacterium]
MTAVVVFGFAVADGHKPVVGAAPWDVLARQLPRQLVQTLNAGQDRGVRFLPYLTNTDGHRTFLWVRELLPAATLASLHHRGDVQLLVDGLVQPDAVRLRAHDGATQKLVLDVEVPFRADRPAEALARMWFEVTGVLGWPGRPQPLEVPPGPALSWWLVAKDQLLSIEAGIPSDPAADILRGARESSAALDVPAVHEVAFETCGHLLRSGQRRDQVAQLLRTIGERTESLASMRRCAGLLQACGDERGAAEVFTKVLAREVLPADVETCAGLWFRLRELQNASSVLQLARERSALSPSGLAQLAAVADRLGNSALRDQITDQLAAMESLPIAAARLVGSFLMEREDVAAARAVLQRAVQSNDGDAGLWLDLGRACLVLEDQDAAVTALERAATIASAGESRRDVERLLRLAKVPGLFAGMRTVDTLLAEGNQRPALRAAREIVRRCRHAAEAWLFLGVVRHKLRQERRAETALRRALALDPLLAEVHNRRGILLVARGQIDVGHDHLLRASELAPTDPSPHLHLAQACVLLGRRADAEFHLRNATDLGARPEMLDAIRRTFFAA